jgi:hypothetical protein
MTDDSDTIAAARDAWARIERSSATTFDDWIAVAKALAVGRAHAMAMAKTNKPYGRRFVGVISGWLREHGLDRVSGQERYRALWVHDRLAEIQAWRATLPEEKRRRLNHPSATWAHFRRATASSSTPAPAHRQVPVGGPRGVTADRLARAADAVFDCLKRGVNDTIVIARKCLEAADRMPSQHRERKRAHVYETQLAT